MSSFMRDSCDERRGRGSSRRRLPRLKKRMERIEGRVAVKKGLLVPDGGGKRRHWNEGRPAGTWGRRGYMAISWDQEKISALCLESSNSRKPVIELNWTGLDFRKFEPRTYIRAG